MSDQQVVHLAGDCITVAGRHMRQRCSWCGAVLIDYDLTRVMSPEGQAGPGGFKPGALIALAGDFPQMSWEIEFDPETGKLSEIDGCCMNLDPAVTG